MDLSKRTVLAVNAVSQASTPDIGEAATAAPQLPVVASPIPSGVPMVNGTLSPLSTSSAHTADGTHLDALVPLRPSSAPGGTTPATFRHMCCQDLSACLGMLQSFIVG